MQQESGCKAIKPYNTDLKGEVLGQMSVDIQKIIFQKAEEIPH
jgi:hypothetical protein